MTSGISIKYKGKNNELIIVLNEDAGFDDIKREFTDKCAQSRKFFSSAAVSVKFAGRALTRTEEDELIDILIGETNIIISDDRDEPEPEHAADTSVAESGDSVAKNTESTHTAKREPEIDYGAAFFHKGTLRSGQDINFNGSVVITGDVNPGGEVMAEGNVVVLGSIKGVVHAGCGGDKTCFVFALNLAPTQLRIADTIAYIPPELVKKSRGRALYAYIDDGRINIRAM